MANLIWAIACEEVIIDSETNLVTLVKVLEEIKGPSFPGNYPRAKLVSLWTKEGRVGQKEVFKFRLKINPPENITPTIAARNQEFSAEIPEGKERLRLTVEINGLPLPGPGILELVIETKEANRWTAVGTYPIKLIKAD